MRKISLLFAIVYSCAFVSPLFAEVNIELLEQKYPRCENKNYRHECFAEQVEGITKEIGYFRNNSLWDGQYFQNDKLIFEIVDGEQIAKSWCNEEKDGWAVCPNGNRFKAFDGGYTDSEGRAQGKWITEYNSGDKHVGEWKDNKKHGQGTYTYANGDKYVGEFRYDKKQGQGAFTWADGDKYVGEFKYGHSNGKGTFTWLSGSKYVGEWKNGKKHGQGTYTYESGNKYVGEYRNGKINGKGTFTYASGDKYVGEWKDGKFHGQGIFTYEDGSKDVGRWAYDRLNGYAIQYDANGNIFREGVFENDEFLYAEKRSENTNPSSGNSKLDKHKEFCEEIGFTPGSEKFAECVMVLIDTD